jgi:predicted ATP-grasp superfamily ATP-dependent carboligase
MVAILDNKARFHRFAEQNGLPVPRTVVFNHVSDLSKLRHLQFPIIVKPADRRLVYLSPAQRLHMPANIREAETLCERLLQTLGEFVIQEWIEGDDSNIYFCLFYRGPDRARTMMFSGRKLLSHPPRAGSTALCVAAPEVERELESFTSKFIGLCEYRGLGSLEFKWDRTRRTFVVIEPTVGRTDWQEEVATLNGVNLPLAAYRDELELPAEATPVPPQLVLWQESARHWPARYALGLRRQTYDGYWRANDPAPAVAYYGNAIFKRICRQLSELVHAGERNRRRKFSVSKQP